MPKKDKELEQMKQVAEGLTTMEEARAAIDNLVGKYDSWMDEAAKHGDDKYSDQLLVEKVSLMEFSDDIKFIEQKIKQSAVSARTFSGLSKLPAAMKACKSLLQRGPDLKGLRNQMNDFEKSLDEARSSLKDLRNDFSKKTDRSYDELFGTKSATDPKHEARIEAEKRARELRLMPKDVIRPVGAEDKEEKSAEAGKVKGAGIDEIIDMINNPEDDD